MLRYFEHLAKRFSTLYARVERGVRDPWRRLGVVKRLQMPVLHTAVFARHEPGWDFFVVPVAKGLVLSGASMAGCLLCRFHIGTPSFIRVRRSLPIRLAERSVLTASLLREIAFMCPSAGGSGVCRVAKQ